MGRPRFDYKTNSSNIINNSSGPLLTIIVSLIIFLFSCSKKQSSSFQKKKVIEIIFRRNELNSDKKVARAKESDYTIHTLLLIFRGQKHIPIRTHAPRGFSVLRDQVLVLSAGQELGTTAVLINV